MAQSSSDSARVFVPPGSEATLADVGRAVARRWRWVALPTAIAFLGSLLFVVMVPPRYTGEARLLLQMSDTYFTRPNGDRGEQLPQIDEQAVASQVQVVMSRDLAREAVKRLGLVGNAEFDPEVGGLSLMQKLGVLIGVTKSPMERPPEERVLDAYFDRLLVYPVGKSRIVAIEFRSKDAELAAKAANTVAELYLDSQQDVKKDQARSASNWLGGNIDGLRKRVGEAEGRVEAFRSKSGLLVGSGTTTLSAQQLSELSAQLAQARTAQSDAQAKARLIRDLVRDGRGTEIPDVANNELIRRLQEQRVTLRTQLALESRTLLPQHPRIKELTAQLQDLDGQVRAAADRTAKTLENDSRIAGSRVESLVAAIEVQKKIVSTANEGEVQLRALEREARIQREQLESYLGRYREAMARDADFGAPPDARIVSRAVTPQTPSFPKKLPIVGMATIATLLLSVGVIAARELLLSRPGEGSVPIPYELTPYEEPRRAGPARDDAFDFGRHMKPQGPLLEAQPVAVAATTEAEPEPIAKAEPVAATPERDEPAVAPDSEYDFGHLVQRLSQCDVGRRGRRVLVTGVETRDRAAAVARGLAQTLSARARVILVTADADEDTPVEARPGLTDLVAGEATFSEVIQREAGSRMHRVPAGTLVNEALTAHPDGLGIALSAFDQTYDWVVCALLGEGGPLLPLFASRVDAVVIASGLEPTDGGLIAAYETARAAGAPEVVVARELAGDFHKAA